LSFLGFGISAALAEALQNFLARVTKLSAFSRFSGVLPNAKILHVTRCYAWLFHGGTPNAKFRPDPFLLYKIDENQLALEAAIMELSNWVEQRGSADIAQSVRGAFG